MGTHVKREPRLARTAALAGLLALVSSLAWAAPAHAQEPPSSVFQYVELVPEASGAKAPGLGKETTTPLPPKAKGALEGVDPETAAALEQVATSSNYGAPANPEPPKTTRLAPPPTDASVEKALAGTVSAVSSTRDRQLVGMLLALLGVTAGAAVLAARRARSSG